MSLTASTMLPLGTSAPTFTLPDTVSGKNQTLADFKSDVATVIMFICNHCPFVLHIRNSLVALVKEYQTKGIQFVAISANDAEQYPEDGPDKMRDFAKAAGFTFSYLYDENQTTAKAYQAACTPDIFVFDKNLKCVYRGRFDESSPGKPIPVTGTDLRAALDNLIHGKAVDPNQKPSMGCNIKWK